MKRAGLVLVLAAMLLPCGACSKGEGAAPGEQPASADAMTDAARAAVAATNAQTGATTAAAGSSAKAVNLLCPIQGDPVTRNGGTVQYAGHTIGFCCAKCSAKFATLDDKSKLAALADHGTSLK